MLHNVIPQIARQECRVVSIQVKRDSNNYINNEKGTPMCSGTFSWVFPSDLVEGTKIYVFSEGNGTQ